VNIGKGGAWLGAVATKDLAPWTVYEGVQAIKVKERVRIA